MLIFLANDPFNPFRGHGEYAGVTRVAPDTRFRLPAVGIRNPFAPADTAEGIHHFTHAQVLADEGAESEPVEFFRMHGRNSIREPHQNDFREQGMKDARRFKSVHDRHAQVNQDDVRNLFAQSVKQLGTITSLQLHMDATAAFEGEQLGKQ